MGARFAIKYPASSTNRGCAVQTEDFEEIAHSGGKITIMVKKGERGLAYAIQYSSSRPNPASIFVIYALPQGLPVEVMPIGGLGVPFPPPTVPGSHMVFIGSDREGWFGKACPDCSGYWRSANTPGSGFCPYCGSVQGGDLFLTEAQNRYVQAVCYRMNEVVNAGEPGDYVIDLDAVADATGQAGEKPAFYYSEERQQTKSTCSACFHQQDIIGRVGYCAVCGTRSDLVALKEDLSKAQDRARQGELVGGLRDAISSFDGCVATIGSELLRRVPLSSARKAYWGAARPKHNIPDLLEKLDDHFGFRTLRALSKGEIENIRLMTARRHVHEHKGGIVDRRYIEETNDTTVRAGQALREEPTTVFDLIGGLSKAAEAMIEGFHELFPPDQSAIENSPDGPRGGRGRA